MVDLSATPFFLRELRATREGTLFPWTASDFSLMDAIECGIVKLPRVPVADNIPGAEMPVFRELWKHIGKDMPKKKRGQKSADPLQLPTKLQTALDALYGHYQQTFEQWREAGIRVPPCFIVVCNNTATSKLVYDYISGFRREREDGPGPLVQGRLPLFRNFDDDGTPLSRPPTLLIDSEQLDSGLALSRDFRTAAADEIERFRREVIERTGDRRQAEGLSDEDLLREVVNTVGVLGRLGEQVRCVVSVSMLSEGWDARTVTHVLGVRAFGTQLLCEQIVGRALRRQSYHLNDETGLFDVEYADVLGIPFDFTGEPVVVKPKPPPPMVLVKAVTPERDACEIRFPRVQGYRVELPDDRLTAKFDDDSTMTLTPELVGPSRVRVEGVIGEGVDLTLVHTNQLRRNTLLYHLTRHLLERHWRDPNDEPRLYLFGELKRMAREWLDRHLVCVGGTYPAQLMYLQLADMACERITNGIVEGHRGDRPITAVLDAYNPEGSTRHVRFTTSKKTRWETVREALPRQLGRLRQHMGGRVLPRRGDASAGARVREEPEPGPGGSVPIRLREPQVHPGFRVAGGGRPRAGRPAPPRRRGQGVPAREREGQGHNHEDVLDSERQPPADLRPVGVPGVHGRVRDGDGLRGGNRRPVGRDDRLDPWTRNRDRGWPRSARGRRPPSRSRPSSTGRPPARTSRQRSSRPCSIPSTTNPSASPSSVGTEIWTRSLSGAARTCRGRPS